MLHTIRAILPAITTPATRFPTTTPGKSLELCGGIGRDSRVPDPVVPQKPENKKPEPGSKDHYDQLRREIGQPKARFHWELAGQPLGQANSLWNFWVDFYDLCGGRDSTRPESENKDSGDNKEPEPGTAAYYKKVREDLEKAGIKGPFTFYWER